MKLIGMAVLMASVAVFAQGPPRGPRGEGPVIESAPVAKNDAEKKALDVLDDIGKNQRRGNMTVPTDDGRLLRVLVESIGAKTVVELGTSVGYSATWMCLGLRKTGGHLTTHEIDPDRAAKARANFKRAGVDDLVTIVEGDAHETLKKFKGTIDIVFLDADKEGYLDYLNTLLPLVRPGGLIVAHNMSPRMADPKYLKAVTTNPDLETVFVNKEAAGVGITLKKR
jgi:predicted O-methyltransferase YrrM